jgi:CBS domain-containing protein
MPSINPGERDLSLDLSRSCAMTKDDAVTFLRQTPPFSFLDETVLAGIVQVVSPAFYPKGQVILRQNGPATEHLILIKSGAVRVYVKTNEDEQVLVDTRTTGEFFGMRSFLFGDISLDTIVAAEDTSCYRITRETILSLLKTNAQFTEFCLRSLLKRLMNMAYKEMHDRTLLYGGGDKLLFTNVLGDLASKNVITASEDATIREAAEIMEDNSIGSLVLLDENGLPSGMVTDRDLRNKVVARGRDTAGRVGDIMSVVLIKAEARDHCFEALLKMMRYNIHHLLVVGKGELKGILSSHDLMMLQGTSPLSLAREIENQDTLDGLVPAAKKINRTITILIREGARASTITRIITEINDRLLKKVLEITESRMGPPPVAYCWIVFGSEGRKEQTFKTDQDNAIIYEDTGDRGKDAAEYFSGFSVQMRDALARCGFPPCSADYMASNPAWRQPLSVWKKYFSDWINIPTPEAVLRSLILFDFRPVYGDLLLAERLRAFLGHEIKDKALFLAHMAGAVVKNRPPVNFLGKLILGKSGANKGTFNIKINGLCPIIDAARLSALEGKVYHTSTIERLEELKDHSYTVGPFAGELELAFEFLMSLRLRHQYRQIQNGQEPDNAIDPLGLAGLERSMLKSSFKLIAAVQERTVKRYGAIAAM